MTERLDIMEQLIDAAQVLPPCDMGDVPEKPFGVVSIIGSTFMGTSMCRIEGENRPVNVDAVDFGSSAKPADFERWQVEGLCEAGGCEWCNSEPYEDEPYEDYYSYYEGTPSTADTLTAAEDRIAELESHVRNLQWQIKTQRELDLKMRSTCEVRECMEHYDWTQLY